MMKFICFSVFMLFAVPSFAGCGQAIGQCTYIDANGEAKVSNAPCLLYACANQNQFLNGMKFLNGTDVNISYPNGEIDVNGTPATDIALVNDEMTPKVRTDKGEIFIANKCKPDTEDDIKCEPFFYPQFWGDIGGFETTSDDIQKLPNGELHEVVNEKNQKLVYFKADDGNIKILARASEFEFIGDVTVIDIDKDGKLEIMLYTGTMGTCCAHIQHYEIYALNDKGEYELVESDLPMVSTSELAIDVDEQTISFDDEMIGMTTELFQKSYKYKFTPERIELISLTEPEYLDAEPEMTTSALVERYASDPSALSNGEIVDSLDFSVAGTNYELSCGYWERWGTYTNCLLNGASFEFGDNCKRIGLLKDHEPAALVCDYDNIFPLDGKAAQKAN